MSKQLLIIGCEGGWAPTEVPGQAGTNRRVMSLNCRVADIHLGGHLSAGFAIWRRVMISCWMLEDMFTVG